MPDPKRQFLSHLFEQAVAAADPLLALKGRLPNPPKGKTVVIGAGKGAAQLARAFEALWEGPYSGVVVTRYDYGAACRNIKVMEAAHPVPDEAGMLAAQALKEAVTGLTANDLVIALICGGGSSLLPDPPEGLSLNDLQDLNRALLASGAPISVMNDIRKCFSGINGGRMAEHAAPARICNLIVSDVPGDAPGEVASGPTVLGRLQPRAVEAMIQSRGIKLPARLMEHLAAQTDAPNSADDPRIETHIIASAALSLEAAANTARAQGVNAWVLSDRIEGEAEDVAQVHAALAMQTATSEFPYTVPVVLLSGGETTVTLRHKGRGGRNAAFQLGLALALEGQTNISALAADTDGIDGTEDNAGAFVDGTTAARMRKVGVNPQAYLQGNDAYSAFEAVNGLFITGPTGTNVNDFRAILIGDLPSCTSKPGGS